MANEVGFTPCPECRKPFLIGVYAYRLAQRFCSTNCIIMYIDSAQPSDLGYAREHEYVQLELPMPV